MIVNELLKLENATYFFLDAILVSKNKFKILISFLQFDNQTVAKKCETFIDKHIDEILSTEDGTNFLLNLPIKYFMSLCKSDALNIHNEYSLIEFI